MDSKMQDRSPVVQRQREYSGYFRTNYTMECSEDITGSTLCQRPKMKGNDTELIKGGNHHVGEKMKKTTPSNKSQEISSWSPT